MRFLFSSLYGSGHLNPVLAYAKALQDRGHDVCICAPESVSGRLRKAGFLHIPGPVTPMEAIVAAYAGTEDLSENEKAKVIISRAFVNLHSRRALPSVQDAIKTWKPDLIIRDSCEFAALIAADEAGIPHVRIAVLNCEMERNFGLHSADALDAIRQKIGLAADHGASVCAEHAFTAFPKSFGQARIADNAPEPVRVRMPNDAPPKQVGPAKWAPTHGKELIYVTFGTQSGTTDRERQMYRTALDAVADFPGRVLLTTGANMAVHPLGPIPQNVCVEEFVPQAQVFPDAKAVVTHGGSGTVLGALAAGIPLVVTPMFSDQPNNARAVEAAGAGLAMFDADVPSLRQAIKHVLANDSFRQGAAKVAAEMADMQGMDVAIKTILTLL
ncbi:MAG: glycosyltransferase [Rhizobiaceae bacterium]|nr:glycosyltransferase [Rhizobiaceae bacterium]